MYSGDSKGDSKMKGDDLDRHELEVWPLIAEEGRQQSRNLRVVLRSIANHEARQAQSMVLNQTDRHGEDFRGSFRCPLPPSRAPAYTAPRRCREVPRAGTRGTRGGSWLGEVRAPSGCEKRVMPRLGAGLRRLSARLLQRGGARRLSRGAPPRRAWA